MDHSPPLPPSLLALLKDLSLEQVEIVSAYCERNRLSIESFINEAVLKAERRYLTEHQGEPGNDWMMETLKNPIFRR